MRRHRPKYDCSAAPWRHYAAQLAAQIAPLREWLGAAGMDREAP